MKVSWDDSQYMEKNVPSQQPGNVLVPLNLNQFWGSERESKTAHLLLWKEPIAPGVQLSHLNGAICGHQSTSSEQNTKPLTCIYRSLSLSPLSPQESSHIFMVDLD